MKQSYTDMYTGLKKMAKEQKLTLSDMFSLVQQGWKKAVQTRPDNLPQGFEPRDYENLSSCAQSSSLELKIEQGEAIHFYMPGREFCDWLVDCATKSDNESLNVAQKIAGRNIGVLHFPTTSKLTSLGYMVGSLNQSSYAQAGKLIPEINLRYDAEGEKSRIVLTFSEIQNYHNLSAISWPLCSNFKEIFNRTTETKTEQENYYYYCCLIAGLGMYISAFGGAVIRDGLPWDLKHPNIHKRPYTQSILVHDSIKQSSHDSPTPHYRRGHFRLLRSERFKHKQGQVVFVKDTFVKGQAKTVEDITQPTTN